MTSHKPRNGLLARLGGREYRASARMSDDTVYLYHDGATAPDDRFAQYADHGVWRLQVPVTECERYVQVTTVARYGRYHCQVEEIGEDNRATLYFMIDVDGTGSTPAGFDQVSPGEFRTTAPLAELHDYHETHRDLLFDHWVGGQR